jgi:hypothetical protein
MPAVSLTDLQQQIAQRERELQTLRAELQSRQSRFSELTRRKEELQSELEQVEEEIAALAAAAAATPTEVPASTAAIAPPSPARSQPRLGELIVTILREAAKPMTARQLNEEAQQRGYQPASRSPVKAIEKRLQDLKGQDVVQRATGQPGFILASSANRAEQPKSKPRQPAPMSTPKLPAKPAKSEPAAKKTSGKTAPLPAAAKTVKPAPRGRQPPLREVLTNVLKSSRKPLSGSELAQRALAAGYQSKSANFVDSVWSALGQMDNVEHLPRLGYRLKKS